MGIRCGRDAPRNVAVLFSHKAGTERAQSKGLGSRDWGICAFAVSLPRKGEFAPVHGSGCWLLVFGCW